MYLSLEAVLIWFVLATVDSSLSDTHRSVHAAILGQPRDDDPNTLLFRGQAPIELDDIVSNLNTNINTSHSVASSSAAPTTSVFSSRKESSVTKPTSNGTSYPISGHDGKGKGTATYAPSLSATHGSGSDTEREAVRNTELLGLGNWAGVEPIRQTRKTKKRPKKPVVIIQTDRPRHVSDDEHDIITQQPDGRNGKSKRMLNNLEYKSILLIILQTPNI